MDITGITVIQVLGTSKKQHLIKKQNRNFENE